jgi:hypothetical protein
MGRRRNSPERDCGTAFSSANPRKVTKPKLFDEATHIRLPAGTKARIDALRGSTRQGDFIRKVLLEALDELEADRNGRGER